MIEVVATPTRSPSRLIESLSLNTIKPDLITLVTNGNHEIDTFGLPVRLIRFHSDEYSYGRNDVALRCNIGIFEAQEDYVIFQGDDQIASPTMIADSIKLFKTKTHFWGHHRYVEFGTHTTGVIMAQPPTSGRSRERGVNILHGNQSCYSGMFGIRADLARRTKFDMAFNGRHAGEDQQLGKRLDGSKVFIHEPPFAWHPTDPSPWEDLGPNNVCDSHTLDKIVIRGAYFLVCLNCPWQQYADSEDRLFNVVEPIIDYDHSKMRIREEVVHAG